MFDLSGAEVIVHGANNINKAQETVDIITAYQYTT